MSVDTIMYCVPVVGYLYLLWMLRAVRSMIFIASVLVSVTLAMQVNASVNFSADEVASTTETVTSAAALFVESSTTSCVI